MTITLCPANGSTPDIAQVSSDLVAQHLAQPETEQVGSIPAVRTSCYISPCSGRAPRTTVAGCTAVGQTGADREIGVDVADAIALTGPLSLHSGELALENLAPAAD